MKTKVFLLGILAACLSIVPASAYGLGDIRVNARFMTDRMAFELHLNANQYNDLYEINYDFFNSINPYIAEIAINANAMNAYYHYLDIRNDDLRWVLTSAEYARFITLDYFFRPLYAVNNVCHLRIYTICPNRTFFYYKPPRHYLTYRGGHCRIHFGGKSYYQRIFPKRYHHPVYSQVCHARPNGPKHDFGHQRPTPGRPQTNPNKNPGFHFSPSAPHKRNGNPPTTNRPPNNKPGNPPGTSGNQPGGRPGVSRPNISRPAKTASRKPAAQNRTSVRKAQPTNKRPVPHTQSSRQTRRTEAKQ